MHKKILYRWHIATSIVLEIQGYLMTNVIIYVMSHLMSSKNDLCNHELDEPGIP